MDNAMELEARKAGFIRQIQSEVNDIGLLDELSNYLQKHLKRNSVPPCRYTPEEMKAHLQEAEEDDVNGNYINHEEFIKETKLWSKKK